MIPVLLVSLTALSGSQERVESKDIHAVLQAAIKSHRVPGMGAAVIQGDRVVLSVAGVRKHGTDVRVETSDLWHLGSDSKAMTSMLVAVLVHEKKLRYELPLEQAFPEMVEGMHPDYRKVTLSMLLRHRAGLPANLPGGWHKISSKLPHRQQREQATRMLLSAAPEVKPGTKFLYSNAGYTIAGHIVERVEQASWETSMRNRIFKPLGMKSAGFGAPGHADRVDQPWPHSATGKPITPGIHADNPSVMSPAGRIHCSLEDWARFVQDLIRGSQGKPALLPAAAYQKMTHPHEGEDYTVGGWLGRGPISHDGSNTMNYCTAVVFPRRGIAVLVTCNQGGKEAGEAAAHEVRKTLVARLAKQQP